MLRIIIYVFALFVFVGLSCTPAEKPVVKNDVELARVFNNKLFLSELEGMIPEGATPEDSTKIVNAEVERWAREALLMHEAGKNISKDLNIDELVRDYRSSLIRHNYEQYLVETQLDSVISQEELLVYYEKNKEQYQLQSSILRCLLIKVPKSSPNVNQLKTWWKSTSEEDYQKMEDYAAQNAAFYLLNNETWYQIADVRSQLPPNTNLGVDQNVEKTEGDFQYFLKVLEKKPRKEIAPIGYIQDQIKKVILHKRKMTLLDKRKEELYDRETNKKNVKIFTK